MLRVDVNRFLQNHVVLLGLGDLLHDFVCLVQNLGQFFVFPVAQIFLEFTALALEFTVLLNQVTLLGHALAFRHGRRIAFKRIGAAL